MTALRRWQETSMDAIPARTCRLLLATIVGLAVRIGGIGGVGHVRHDGGPAVTCPIQDIGTIEKE